MISWSTKRRIIYLAVFLVILAVIGGTLLFFSLHTAPTCFDGKQNGGEAGVDCGGSCVRVCENSAATPIVLWERALEVTPGVYSLIALVQNPNQYSSAMNVPYEFKLLDRTGKLIATKQGRTNLLPGQSTPIFEQNISLPNQTVGNTSFAFTEQPVWYVNMLPVSDLRVTEKHIDRDETAPRLRATIYNASPKMIEDLPVIAIIYDQNGTVMAASRTFIDEIQPNESQIAIFTWQQPFPSQYFRVDVIPKLGNER